jgi:regulatory protein
VTDVITALQADQADPDKVQLFVDGRHIMVVSLEVAAAEKLAVGQACPPERIERLHRAQELNSIYESALAFLSYMPRSEREVEMRLRKKGHAPEEIAAVIERLKGMGYVDDREFARFWVGNRMTFSPRGPRLLRSELFQKGVPREIIDDVLAEHQEAQTEREQQAEEIASDYELNGDELAPGSDLANAVALARKRIRSLSNLEPQVARRRLSGFLARRGYNYETISDAIRRVLAEDEDQSN